MAPLQIPQPPPTTEVSTSQHSYKSSRKPELTRIAIFEPQDQGTRPTISWVGPSQQICGYTLEEIEDTEEWWLDHIHPDNVQEVLSKYRQLFQAFPSSPHCSEARLWSADYRFRRRDGTYLLVSERGTTIRNEQGHVVKLTSVIIDNVLQKKRRQAHKKDLEQQNYLAMVAENTPSGIYLMDNQGYVIYMNKAAELITGFTFEELSAYTFHASCHSCRPDGTQYPIEECPVLHHQQANVSLQNYPEVFVHKNGQFYDVVYSISPIGGDYGTLGAMIEFRDVTEQRRMERERLDAILDNQQKGIVLKESQNHKEELANFVAFLAHESRNPLQGITASAEFLLDSMKELEALTERLSSLSVEGAAQGHDHTAQMQKLNLNSNNNTASPTSDNNNQLRQSINDIATNLKKGLHNAQEYITNIQTCADHQAVIINNTLDLSRLDAGKVEPFLETTDVLALGRQTISMMTARAKSKSISLSLVNNSHPSLHLKVDPTMLTQVVLNLLSNALKFTPHHGTIRLTLEADQSTSNTVLHGAVTDNGPGLTTEEKSRLFKRFSQANAQVAQNYGGSGLGLNISKELVICLGGDMHVESTKGKGSTFSFTIKAPMPTEEELSQYLKQQHSSIGQPETTSLPAVNGRGGAPLSRYPSPIPTFEIPSFKVIGVAEDNPINLKYICKILKSLGYHPVPFTSGVGLVNHFNSASTPEFHAIVTDLIMPEMTGLEATRLIRESEAADGKDRSPVPIIALSGNSLTEQVAQAFEAGVSDYLLKPAKKADLMNTLRYWQAIVHSGEEHQPMGETLRRIASGDREKT